MRIGPGPALRAETPPQRPMRVFVVENHDDSRTMLCMLLQALGCHVEWAATMGQALKELASNRYDLVLSDIGLPDGDGWELLSRLQATSPPAYAVAMSGFGMAADRERSHAAGFRHHLVKPMRIEQLECLLSEAAAVRAGIQPPA